MARPNKTIPPAKTHQLPVRFTEEEYEILSKNSKQFNMSRGEYLRHILVHKKVNPPKMIFHNDSEITSELRKLSKIGSNLNQLARFCNEHSMMNDPIKKQLMYVLGQLELLIINANRALEDEYGRH